MTTRRRQKKTLTPPSRARARRDVLTLVLSPTRELAAQIENEARKLTKFDPINLICVIGGTNIKTDQRKLAAGPPVDVLVATPGRLIDHLENTPGVAEAVRALKILIFDEADQLLEMGFKVRGGGPSGGGTRTRTNR